jgi:hypothetical protein
VRVLLLPMVTFTVGALRLYYTRQEALDGLRPWHRAPREDTHLSDHSRARVGDGSDAAPTAAACTHRGKEPEPPEDSDGAASPEP